MACCDSVIPCLHELRKFVQSNNLVDVCIGCVIKFYLGIINISKGRKLLNSGALNTVVKLLTWYITYYCSYINPEILVYLKGYYETQVATHVKFVLHKLFAKHVVLFTKEVEHGIDLLCVQLNMWLDCCERCVPYGPLVYIETRILLPKLFPTES